MTTTEKQTEKLYEELGQCLSQLEEEYPGISRIRFNPSPPFLSKLKKLVIKLNYSLPKSFYSDEAFEFERELEQVYFRHLDSQFRTSDCRDSSCEQIEVMRRISDQQEAILPIQTSSQEEPVSFDNSAVRAFVESFNSDESKIHINRGLLASIANIMTCKKQQDKIEASQPAIRFGGRKPQQNDKNKEGGVRRNYAKKETIRENQSPQKPIITLGGNIPIEVKEMYNLVKKMSNTSFGVTSLQSQSEMPEEKLAEIQILYLVNQLAPQFVSDIYEQLKVYIVSSQNNATFFIEKMMFKCEFEYKSIDFYVNFINKFNKISCEEFKWQFTDGKKSTRKFNPFFRTFTHKMQQYFQQETESLGSKRLVSICNMLGHLVKKRAISKQICQDVNNSLLERVIRQIKSDNNVEKIQIGLKAEIALIEGLVDSFSDKIWEKCGKVDFMVKNQQILDYVGDKSGDLLQLLARFIEKAQLPTDQMESLLIVLTRRKGKKQMSEEKTNYQINEVEDREHPLVEALYSNSTKTIKSVLEKFGDSIETFSVIFNTISDGKKEEVENWIELVIETIKSGRNFTAAWNGCWRDLIFKECEYPFMVPAIASLSHHYLGDEKMMCVIEIEEEDPDYEDCVYFMDKLSRKLEQTKGEFHGL